MASFATATSSVAEWVAHLSPAAMADYILTSYNGLLSWSALELLTHEDFQAAPDMPDGQGQDTVNVQNLRAALTELYPGHTLALWRVAGRGHLVITVPGGNADTWPAQIPQPAAQQ